MLKYEKEKEKQAFKQMTLKQKLEHIVTYYWIPIVSGICGFLFFLWCMNHYVWNPPKDYSLHIFGVSSTALNANGDTVVDEMLNEKLPELNTDRETVNYQGMFLGNDEYNEIYLQKIAAEIAAQDLDIMIGTEEDMIGFAKIGYLMNLDEFLTDEEKETWPVLITESIVTEIDSYGRPTQFDGPYQMLIEIPNGPITSQNFWHSQEKLYVGIVANTQRTDACHLFLKVMAEHNQREE